MSAKDRAFGSIGQLMRWCGLLALIFVVLILTLPYDDTTVRSYHLSVLEYRVVELMINLPVIAVWFFAFWGYGKLKQYATYIKKTKEGPHFDKLAQGAAWLAWSLPITALVGRVLSSIDASHQSFRSAQIIIYNYVELILPFVGLLIIGSAARGINGNRRIDLKLTSTRIIMALFVAAGVLYCYLILKAFNLSSLASQHNPYYLPAWLMVVSVIIPYLYAWFIGLLAAYQITVYASSISGVLYKRALLAVTAGLTSIIFSFVVVQYLSSIWPNTGHLVFNYRLVIVTLFRIVGGVGYVAMAIGANRLKKIEEV